MSDERTLHDLTIKELLCLQVQLLMEIRDGFVADAAQTEGCPHPEERRVDLSTLGDANHWVCRDCQYDSKADAAMN